MPFEDQDMPIRRSTYGFCHGDLGDVGRSRIPIVRTRLVKVLPRHHCRAPNRSEPCSTGMPPRSVVRATPRSDAGSPQTRAAVVVRDPRRQTQTGTRTSGLEPRKDRSPRLRPHGCAGTSASSVTAVLGAGSCTWRPSTRRSRTRASAVHPSCPDCIIATCGYDFRDGHRYSQRSAPLFSRYGF